jgi:type VI secretion system protein
MPEHGFLEKMLGPLGKREHEAQARWVGDPVRTHLTLLLNTRRGSVPSQPDYGLPDVSGFYSEYPASLSDLRAIMEEMIAKYEPRLCSPRVRIIETDRKEFRVSFLITGEIEEEDGGTAVVQYRTTISSNGRAEIGD